MRRVALLLLLMFLTLDTVSNAQNPRDASFRSVINDSWAEMWLGPRGDPVTTGSVIRLYYEDYIQNPGTDSYRSIWVDTSGVLHIDGFTGGGGGASSFLDLTDSPSSYSGEALKLVRVNAGETGVEFVTPSASHDPVTLDANADTLLSLSTQELGLDTQADNVVFAGPTTGGPSVPSFRSLVAGDIPDLSGTYLTSESDPVFSAMNTEAELESQLSDVTDVYTNNDFDIADYQPLDADLTALAALASTGIAVRYSADSWILRTITGDSEIVVSNGSGQAGNPTLSIGSTITRDSEWDTQGEVETIWGVTLATDSELGAYLPLAGGTMTGAIESATDLTFKVDNNDDGSNYFYVRNGGDTDLLTIDENGGTKIDLAGAGRVMFGINPNTATYSDTDSFGAFWSASNFIMRAVRNGTAWRGMYFDASGMYFRPSGGTAAATIDSSGNAEITGSLKVDNLTIDGLTIYSDSTQSIYGLNVDNYWRADSGILYGKVGGNVELAVTPTALRPFTNQGLTLGQSGTVFGAMYVDNLLADGNTLSATDDSGIYLLDNAGEGVGVADGGEVTMTNGANINRDLSISGATPYVDLSETDSTTNARLILSGGVTYLQAGQSGSGTGSFGGDLYFSGYNASNINSLAVRSGGAWNDIWHEGNDGSGSGLDADLLDGYNASVSAVGNTIVQRHSSGYIYANYFNTTAPDPGSPATYVFASADSFIRKRSIANIFSDIEGTVGTITIADDPEFIGGAWEFSGGGPILFDDGIELDGDVTFSANQAYDIGTLATSARTVYARNYIAATSGVLGFWGSSTSYMMQMGTGTFFHMGPVSNYSIRSVMSNTPNRGFTWGPTNGSIPTMAFDVYNGDLRVRGGFEVENSIFMYNHGASTGDARLNERFITIDDAGGAEVAPASGWVTLFELDLDRIDPSGIYYINAYGTAEFCAGGDYSVGSVVGETRTFYAQWYSTSADGYGDYAGTERGTAPADAAFRVSQSGHTLLFQCDATGSPDLWATVRVTCVLAIGDGP